MTQLSANPLVSIVVITYNSDEFVLDTLESAKAQTYRNIELIVSDDCSTDETVETCHRWIEENKERFVRTELITTERNSGIPANCNRGFMAARGEWVKGIAGDDLISENFISKCLEEQIEEDVGIIYTNTSFINSKGEITKEAHSSNYKSGHVFDDLFHLRFWPKAPSLIIRRSAMDEFGFFDESIWTEDYLMVLRIASKYQLSHINEFLTYYRIHGGNSGGNHIRLYQAQLCTIERFKDYPGYPERRRQILLQILKINSIQQPHEALKLIRENLSFLICPKGVSALFRTLWSLVRS